MPVLVVDDEPSNVVLMERMLLAGGFSCIRTEVDPTRILPAIESDVPDLILLDLHMPEVDGFHVLAEISKMFKHGFSPPVVVVTADTSRETLKRALNYGAVDFITKPVDQTELVLRVRNHLHFRRMALQLDTRLQAVEAELESERLEAIERLAFAAEARESGMGEHIRGIDDLSAAIARELGMTNGEAAVLGRAARVHDIGKIAVPDSILLKPGPLDAAEREVMRSHTTVGGAILAGSRSPVLRIAEQIALGHHEHWDGNGYPAGVAGAEIPLPARVVAVADVFDALIHERAYKLAWPVSRAITEIVSKRDTQFDPDVIDAFVRVDVYELLAHPHASEGRDTGRRAAA